MPTRFAKAGLLVLPENRSAFAAIQDLLAALVGGNQDEVVSPLYVFGPSGSGKTMLMNTLVDELAPVGIDVRFSSANDFADDDGFQSADQVGLWIVEDLQHLPMRCVSSFVATLDERTRCGMPTVVTANHGPSRLRHRGVCYPHRFTNRLAGGLVVGIEPMQTPSRRGLLEALAQDIQPAIPPEALDWLAERLHGGRQLAGAIRQLQSLQTLPKKSLRLDDIKAHFRAQTDATVPTVKRIVEFVGGHYGVKPKLLASATRCHDVLMPRHVSMYLARQLTTVSLEKIGAYFGGRDHKTVIHACQKIDNAMKQDAALYATIRQMRGALA